MLTSYGSWWILQPIWISLSEPSPEISRPAFVAAYGGSLNSSPHMRSDSPLRAYTLIAALILLPACLVAPLATDAQQAGKGAWTGFLCVAAPFRLAALARRVPAKAARARVG